MGQNQFLTTLALISIFTLAVLTMTLSLSLDSDSKIDLSGDDSFFKDMNTTITTNADESFTVSNASGTSFALSSVDVGEQVSVKGTEFKNAPSGDLKTTYNILRNAQKALFGEDRGFNTIFTIMISLIATIAFFLAYKTWVGKNPD